MKKAEITYGLTIGIHVIIGILIYFNESLAKLYFFGAVCVFGFRIIVSKPNDKTYEILKTAAYFVGAEVLLRTTKGAISYEAGKYVVILLMTIGMFYKGISGKAYPYILYILMMVPSIFVASTTLSFDANFRTNIAFVLSGPVCLGIAALFLYNKAITRQKLDNVILMIGLPIITHTTYILFYNPTVKAVLSGTESNRSASGGWGANQVSCILGLGMLIFAIRFFKNSPNLNLKLLNAFLFSVISYRALVTFSRGGVLTAILSIAAFLAIYFAFTTSKKRNEIIIGGLLFGFITFGVWTYSSMQTDGLLDLRYENRDHLGREKEDVTTGRLTLFLEEMEGFIHNPFFGIGSSRAKDERVEIEGQGTTSHNEMSRTLAEHGFFGIIMILVLIFKPIWFRSLNKKNVYFYAFLGFWFATINHSSMRIAAPAFVYALALLNVVNEKSFIYRQQPRLQTSEPQLQQ
ncbi:O-antigen ligase family protein [Aegicerativicinus sediminis]|uniref:O-antigen ligase family protein n=1 Tax=Aegicerativicinus sediminis TaxID=2893202 RepID=UPI001E30C50D|nr:O-antigen ligase family protein [Aegicerativicinus sediminis]